MWPFSYRSSTTPAMITADRNSVIITIRKDWLSAHPDTGAAHLLCALEGEDHGDWGGAEYPKIALGPNCATSIVRAIETTASRSIQLEP
jgi:hypothetical protein